MFLEENFSENDEADMFDDSDEEIGSGDVKRTAVRQEDNVTTLDSGLAFALDYSPDSKVVVHKIMLLLNCTPDSWIWVYNYVN